MYLSIEQLGKRMNKKERQIRYLIQQGIAQPVNSDTFRRDGGYRFTEEEANRLETLYRITDLTLEEAASYIGITPQYLLRFVKEGKINSWVKVIGRQKRRLFRRPECERFKKEYTKLSQMNLEGEYKGKVQLISREVRIFDTMLWNGELMRVVGVSPVQLLAPSGELIQLSGVKDQSTPWPEKKYIRKKGFVVFEIPVPRHMNHPVYDLVYRLIEQLGERNIQIYEGRYGDYIVYCRQGIIDHQHEHIQLLRKYLKSGKVVEQGDQILLRTAYISKTIHIPEEIWDHVQQISRNTQQPVEKVIQQALSQYQSNSD